MYGCAWYHNSTSTFHVHLSPGNRVVLYCKHVDASKLLKKNKRTCEEKKDTDQKYDKASHQRSWQANWRKDDL